MDNFLIFIIIACAILWWDSRKRAKEIKQSWENIGVQENTPIEMTFQKTPDTPKMTQEELIEILAAWKQIVPTQTDDELIADLVDEVLTEMPSNEIADAKSALKALGYKNRDIKKAVGEITNTMGGNMKSGEIVTSALRILNA